MSTEQAHLESYERDLANDFKDIDKRYTAQLVQVKVCTFFRQHLTPLTQILDFRHGEQRPRKIRQSPGQVRRRLSDRWKGAD